MCLNIGTDMKAWTTTLSSTRTETAAATTRKSTSMRSERRRLAGWPSGCGSAGKVAKVWSIPSPFVCLMIVRGWGINSILHAKFFMRGVVVGCFIHRMRIDGSRVSICWFTMHVTARSETVKALLVI